jgi:hypothetical protein
MKLNRIKEIFDKKGIKQTCPVEKNGYACSRQQPHLEALHQIAEDIECGCENLFTGKIEV